MRILFYLICGILMVLGQGYIFSFKEHNACTLTNVTDKSWLVHMEIPANESGNCTLPANAKDFIQFGVNSPALLYDKSSADNLRIRLHGGGDWAAYGTPYGEDMVLPQTVGPIPFAPYPTPSSISLFPFAKEWYFFKCQYGFNGWDLFGDDEDYYQWQVDADAAGQVKGSGYHAVNNSIVERRPHFEPWGVNSYVPIAACRSKMPWTASYVLEIFNNNTTPMKIVINVGKNDGSSDITDMILDSDAPWWTVPTSMWWITYKMWWWSSTGWLHLGLRWIPIAATLLISTFTWYLYGKRDARDYLDRTFIAWLCGSFMLGNSAQFITRLLQLYIHDSKLEFDLFIPIVFHILLPIVITLLFFIWPFLNFCSINGRCTWCGLEAGVQAGTVPLFLFCTIGLFYALFCLWQVPYAIVLACMVVLGKLLRLRNAPKSRNPGV